MRQPLRHIESSFNACKVSIAASENSCTRMLFRKRRTCALRLRLAKEDAVIQAVKLSIVVGSVFQCFMLPHDAK